MFLWNKDIEIYFYNLYMILLDTGQTKQNRFQYCKNLPWQIVQKINKKYEENQKLF